MNRSRSRSTSGSSTATTRSSSGWSSPRGRGHLRRQKYYIPGCATHEIIDLSHWVGALIGVEGIIGVPEVTPVRAIINAGAELIPTERLALCLVVESGTGELEAASFGTAEDAWAATAPIAAESHIVYTDTPYQRLLAMMPTRYDDIWTAAKGCYKAQPAMADGGEVIIYALHVTEVCETHPEIYDIGYHCIEYFTRQWDRFSHVPKGGLRRTPRTCAAPGRTTPRPASRPTACASRSRPASAARCASRSTSATSTRPRSTSRRKADPDIMVVENAGEVLYRLRTS